VALTITHPFVSAIADDPAAAAAGQVVPSNWNASHSISGTLPAANIAPAGSTTQVQFNLGGALSADSGFTYAGSGGVVTIAQGTIAANAKALNITGTFNNAGVSFDAPLFMSITDSASAATSLISDFQVGASSVFAVRKDGLAFSNAGFSAGFGSNISAAVTTGGAPGVFINSTSACNWGSGSNALAGSDVSLFRDGAAGILAQRVGTNAQSFKVYNTYTDGSNYERGIFDWKKTSNTLTIGTENAGTGTARNLQFIVGGTSKADYGITTASTWTFSAAASSTGAVTAMSATAIPAGGTAGAGVLVSSTANFGVFFGSGAPSLSAAKGSLYLRSDGSTTNDRMYVNTNGSTTWTAVTTVA